jgi:ankyrin repeat protein
MQRGPGSVLSGVVPLPGFNGGSTGTVVALLLFAAAACTQGPADRQKLADAISREDVAAFTGEIQRGFSADVENASDGKGGITLIHEAANCNNTEFLRLLIDRGVKVDLRTETGETPLVLAAAFGKTEAARFLVDHGAAIDAGINSRVGTPLMAAAREGHLEIVKLVVEHGANVSEGQLFTEPLYLAADGGHRAVVEYLISKGATSNEMQTAALEGKQPELAKLLSQSDFITRVNERSRAVIAEVDEIKRTVEAMQRRAQETGQPIDQGKIEQYKARLAQLQKELAGR